MEKQICLTAEQKNKMLCHVLESNGEEVCGLLAGHGSIIDVVVPVTNIKHSAVRFMMDPVEQLHAFTFFDQQGLILVGIYHSHIYGPAIPSETDIQEFAYPGVFQLIWFPDLNINGWDMRAYLIEGTQFEEIEVVITST